jgi:hypothetical protein
MSLVARRTGVTTGARGRSNADAGILVRVGVGMHRRTPRVPAVVSVNAPIKVAVAVALILIAGSLGASYAGAAQSPARASGTSSTVACKGTAKRLHSGRVRVDYSCTGIMVDRMKIVSNRKITYAKAEEEISTCIRPSARVAECYESGVTSEVTEPSAAIIGVSGRLCRSHGNLNLRLVLTGRNEAEFDEEAKSEVAVKGPC